MTEIFAFVEHAEEKIQRSSQEAVSEAVRQAGRLGARCTALVLGRRIPPGIPADLGRLKVGRGIVCEDESLPDRFSARHIDLLEGILRDRRPDLLLMGGSAVARELAPRLSARLGWGLVTEATFLQHRDGGFKVTRAAFRPHASMICSFPGGGPAIVTTAPGVMEVERIGPRDPVPLEIVDPGCIPLTFREDGVTVERAVREIPSRVDLSDASVVVAGGRGMQAGGNFRLLEELAEVLGGVVGATRMAVDMQWRPRESLVGVTGKVVSPDLYIACGISGAIQHVMGMRSSETILAINTDPHAPIFRIATLGIVGDVTVVLPAMIDAFRKAAQAAERGGISA